MIELLKTLTVPFGVSGFETSVSDTVEALFAPYGDVTRDRLGNVICHKKGPGARLLIEAHADEIGLIVTEVMGGFLRFAAIGGTDAKILPGSEVTVYGETPVPGVIGIRPPHLKKAGENTDVLTDRLVIDIGDADGVSVGDIALYTSPFTVLGQRVSARNLDNRASLAVLIHALSHLKSSDYDLYFAATTGEETTMRGAHSIADAVRPDYALSVDVTFGASEGSSDKSFPLGGGPTVCISPTLDAGFTRALFSLAEKKGITVARETEGGSTGTNAWAIAKSATSSRCALLSIPIRYMHTSVEVADLSDLTVASDLLIALMEGGVSLA